jgi:hypothetical protein
MGLLLAHGKILQPQASVNLGEGEFNASTLQLNHRFVLKHIYGGIYIYTIKLKMLKNAENHFCLKGI